MKIIFIILISLLISDNNSIKQWDSVGHMSMIANLEEAFDIVFDMDDIIDFSSYKTGIEILKKYKINI